MTKQKKHVRTSKKGTKFVAGTKKRPITTPILRINKVPEFKRQMSILRHYKETIIRITKQKISCITMNHENTALLKFNWNAPNILNPLTFKIQPDELEALVSKKTAKDDVLLHYNMQEKAIFTTDYPRGMIRLYNTIQKPTEQDLKEEKKYGEILNKLKTDAKRKFVLQGGNLAEFIYKIKKAIKEKTNIIITILPNQTEPTILIENPELKNSKRPYPTVKINPRIIKNIFPVINRGTMLRIHWENKHPIIIGIEHQKYEHELLIAPIIEND